MGNPKRMSEMFASSAEKDANTATVAASPPYSSEGPTLPIIGTPEDAPTAGKKRKAHDKINGSVSKKPSQPPSPPTIHPSLYEPWTRLPTELRKLLETQKRMRATQNIVPVVFSKNQNIRSGINRLKTYLGAYKDAASTIEMPDALKEDDVIIAVSAQGEGTTKLVGIVDMVRRIVAPSGEEDDNHGKEKAWWMYTMLTSVEVDREIKTPRPMDKGAADVEKIQSTQDNEDLSNENNTVKRRKVPVMTVWMTKKRIAVFGNVFGEQTFAVKLLSQDSD
ncbi:hypothetical protein BKA58DRAFT_124711 [Alternaria rosae]|uniref:uncharacterized protein n=1 Tax=Alternaria rosae TaxID=1187941 RepID=UPI001E8DD376|nr:uncharacterized protein BKA58DRAFT_124711 [Alternaria rosae]KAH6875587.1 hypothetical protein BKA58DRAFT_124711 [Alternaria rosae]